MKHELNIWVVGGDLRQAKLAQLLAEDGHTVHTYALGTPQEQVPGLTAEPSLRRADKADCVILPLTISTGDGLLNAPLSLSEHPLAPILDQLSPHQFLCGGRVDRETEELARERGLTIHDYFAREELAVANAVPTALAVGHSFLGTQSPLTFPCILGKLLITFQRGELYAGRYRDQRTSTNGNLPVCRKTSAE